MDLPLKILVFWDSTSGSRLRQVTDLECFTLLWQLDGLLPRQCAALLNLTPENKTGLKTDFLSSQKIININDLRLERGAAFVRYGAVKSCVHIPGCRLLSV